MPGIKPRIFCMQHRHSTPELWLLPQEKGILLPRLLALGPREKSITILYFLARFHPFHFYLTNPFLFYLMECTVGGTLSISSSMQEESSKHPMLKIKRKATATHTCAWITFGTLAQCAIYLAKLLLFGLKMALRQTPSENRLDLNIWVSQPIHRYLPHQFRPLCTLQWPYGTL